MANEDVYKRMLAATFTVDLRRGEELLSIICRDLPFTTLMHILGEVVSSASEEIAKTKDILITQIQQSGGLLDTSSDAFKQDFLVPMVSAIALELPAVAERFLLDVVVESDKEKLKLFTLEDTFAIFSGTIERVDVERVSELARSIFIRATALSKGILEKQAKKEAVAKKRKMTLK